MKFCSEAAIEMANALLDAVEIAKETGAPCYVSKVGSRLVAIDDVDTNFVIYKVDPPIPDPEVGVERAA
jgi:hypothetical protein